MVHGHPENGHALVLKWTGTHRPNRGFEVMPAMLTARTAAELAAAQDGWVNPVNNLVCADTGGHIAYQCRGELPVRSSDGARAAAGTRLGRLRASGRGPCRSPSCRGPSTPRPGS